MRAPTTRYARSGDLHLAYQVVGDGPVDLVVAPGFITHCDLNWTMPAYVDFIERLASFSRVILFDKRGITTFGDEVIAAEEVRSPETGVDPPVWRIREGSVPPVGTEVTVVVRRPDPDSE